MLTFKIIEKEIDIILGIITDFQNDARVLVETLSYLHGLEIDKKFPMNTFALLKGDKSCVQRLYLLHNPRLFLILLISPQKYQSFASRF
jgi:hypothetical protein